MTAAAATASIGIGMAPAMAVPINVALGSHTTTQYFVGTSGPVTYSSGLFVNCPSALIYGTLKPGAHNTDAVIGSSTSVWNGCTTTFPGQPPMLSTVTQNSDAEIVATGAPVGGVTPVKITNLNVTMRTTGGICMLKLTGTQSGNFNNANQKLTLTGTGSLITTSSGFCLGAAPTGTVSATYRVIETATGLPFPVTIS